MGRGTTCSGRSARSAQLGDDEGDHAARSASRGQEPTPSSPPGRRIETSLRRKRVRGGGSRRACGARASGVEDRDEPAAQKPSGVEDRDEPVCLRQEGAAGAGGASEPSSTSIPIEGVTLLPFRSHSDHVSRLGPTADLREPSHAGHARLPEPWRHAIEGWSAAGALAGAAAPSGVAGACGGVNVLHAPAGPGRAPPLRSGARPGPAARSAKRQAALSTRLAGGLWPAQSHSNAGGISEYLLFPPLVRRVPAGRPIEAPNNLPE